jgi:LemA protein
MSRNVIILAALVGFFLIFGLWGCSSYNGMVDKQLVVDQKWADVQSAYQRRLDLIPNLVSTVKGYADFEKSTLTAVTEARAKATSININAADMTEENMKKFQSAQNGLAGALKSLLAVSENYPDLKANTNFLELQTELSRTENRINVSRNDYNAAVKLYNSAVMRFPGKIIAGITGFEPRAMFTADAGAEKAPTVKF